MFARGIIFASFNEIDFADVAALFMHISCKINLLLALHMGKYILGRIKKSTKSYPKFIHDNCEFRLSHVCKKQENIVCTIKRYS